LQLFQLADHHHLLHEYIVAEYFQGSSLLEGKQQHLMDLQETTERK
jgi:hypothetical protein